MGTADHRKCFKTITREKRKCSWLLTRRSGADVYLGSIHGVFSICLE